MPDEDQGNGQEADGQRDYIGGNMLKNIVSEKVVGMIVLLALAIGAYITEVGAKDIVIPIVTAIAGFITGQKGEQNGND